MSSFTFSERQMAIAKGQTRYLGSSCEKGHDGWRWTGSGNCITCVRLKYVKHGKRGKKPCHFRAAAKEKGEIYYFTDRPCLRGHLAKRRTATGSCQDCHNSAHKDSGRDYTLRSKYKITLKQYNELLEIQNGLCAICGQKESAIDKTTKVIRTLSVDHCHNSKKVRGLLCSSCNVGIGNLKHDPEILRKAALYCEAV